MFPGMPGLGGAGEGHSHQLERGSPCRAGRGSRPDGVGELRRGIAGRSLGRTDGWGRCGCVMTGLLVTRLSAAAFRASRPDAEDRRLWGVRLEPMRRCRSRRIRQSARTLLAVRAWRGRVQRRGVGRHSPAGQCRDGNAHGDPRRGGQAPNVHCCRLSKSRHAGYQLPWRLGGIRLTAKANGDTIVSPLPTTTRLKVYLLKRTPSPVRSYAAGGAVFRKPAARVPGSPCTATPGAAAG